MSIFRSNHNKNFTTICNYIATDKNLSWKAKGIYLYAFSKPDDWKFREKDIINNSTDGRDSIRAGLKELEKHGYLVRTQENENGIFGEVIYDFYEVPQEVQKNITANGKTVDGKPVHILSTDITKERDIGSTSDNSEKSQAEGNSDSEGKEKKTKDSKQTFSSEAEKSPPHTNVPDSTKYFTSQLKEKEYEKSDGHEDRNEVKSSKRSKAVEGVSKSDFYHFIVRKERVREKQGLPKFKTEHVEEAYRQIEKRIYYIADWTSYVETTLENLEKKENFNSQESKTWKKEKENSKNFKGNTKKTGPEKSKTSKENTSESVTSAPHSQKLQTCLEAHTVVMKTR